MVHIFPSMLNIMSCFGFGIAGAMTIGTKTEQGMYTKTFRFSQDEQLEQLNDETEQNCRETGLLCCIFGDPWLNILMGISVQVVGISAKHHLQLMRWEPVPDWTHLAGGNISLGTSLLRATSSPSGFAHPAFDDPIGHIARSQWPGSTIISCHISILTNDSLHVSAFRGSFSSAQRAQEIGAELTLLRSWNL